MADYDIMPDTTLPSRRARRAADAALRADVRRRDRIDRYARTAPPHAVRRAHRAPVSPP